MQEPTQLPMPIQPASDLISMEPAAPEELKQETIDDQPMEVDTIVAAAAATSSPPAEESAAAEQPKVQVRKRSTIFEISDTVLSEALCF